MSGEQEMADNRSSRKSRLTPRTPLPKLLKRKGLRYCLKAGIGFSDIFVAQWVSWLYIDINTPAAPLSRKGDAHQGQVFLCAELGVVA